MRRVFETRLQLCSAVDTLSVAAIRALSPPAPGAAGAFLTSLLRAKEMER